MIKLAIVREKLTSDYWREILPLLTLWSSERWHWEEKQGSGWTDRGEKLVYDLGVSNNIEIVKTGYFSTSL